MFCYSVRSTSCFSLLEDCHGYFSPLILNTSFRIRFFSSFVSSLVWFGNHTSAFILFKSLEQISKIGIVCLL